jgi:hypothetical protein
MGTDSKDVLVVNKNTYDINENLYLDLGEGGFFMSTGDYIYYMSTYGDIQMIYYDYDLDCYTSMAVFQPDMSQVFDDIDGIEITAATYRNSKIYFIAVKDIYSSVDKLIGKETAFCSYDFNTDKTKYLCDIPNEMVEGYSLATYNGGVYLLGGYDASTKVGDYTTAFYKYTSDGFKQQNASLPSGRAYGECVQYYDKLVYMYGTSSSNTEIPSALVYDGKTWTQSAVKLSSEDCNEIEFNDGKKAYYYEGNLGVCDYGVFCSGAFVYGIGDTFIYDVDEDSVSGYDNVTFSTELDDIPLYGTTVDGAFVGATLDENTLESVGYQLGIDTAFPVLSFDYSNDNYYLSASSDNYTYAFGDSVTITATPANGYVVTAIYANGKKYTPSSKNSATIVINDDTYVYATVKKVAPNKVNDLKVSSTSASSVTLSWSKPARAVGYQVQEYKNKKWTTVKTIKSSDTTTCKLTGLSAGTHKYRVRAYSTYNSKTYYGDYSSTLSVYVPSKQAITSVKAGSASFTVAYKQNKNATGYQVQYSTSSKFTNATTKTVSKNTTTSYTASKLTAKKKYYVRVRSYKTVNGKKVYGAWSDAKNVTTK